MLLRNSVCFLALIFEVRRYAPKGIVRECNPCPYPAVLRHSVYAGTVAKRVSPRCPRGYSFACNTYSDADPNAHGNCDWNANTYTNEDSHTYTNEDSHTYAN